MLRGGLILLLSVLNGVHVGGKALIVFFAMLAHGGQATEFTVRPEGLKYQCGRTMARLRDMSPSPNDPKRVAIF